MDELQQKQLETLQKEIDRRREEHQSGVSGKRSRRRWFRAFLGVIAGILLLEPRIKIAKENGPLAVFGISLAGVAFTAYLTWLEIYIIHAICPFCVASAIIIALIFVLAIFRLITQIAY